MLLKANTNGNCLTLILAMSRSLIAQSKVHPPPDPAPTECLNMSFPLSSEQDKVTFLEEIVQGVVHQSWLLTKEAYQNGLFFGVAKETPKSVATASCLPCERSTIPVT